MTNSKNIHFKNEVEEKLNKATNEEELFDAYNKIHNELMPDEDVLLKILNDIHYEHEQRIKSMMKKGGEVNFKYYWKYLGMPTQIRHYKSKYFNTIDAAKDWIKTKKPVSGMLYDGETKQIVATYLDKKFSPVKLEKGGKVDKVKKVMKEFSESKLHSGSKKGPIVKNKKQAIAIALSEQREQKKGWRHKK